MCELHLPADVMPDLARKRVLACGATTINVRLKGQIFEPLLQLFFSPVDVAMAGVDPAVRDKILQDPQAESCSASPIFLLEYQQ